MDLKQAYEECFKGDEEHRDAAWHNFVSIALHEMQEKYPNRKYPYHITEKENE